LSQKVFIFRFVQILFYRINFSLNNYLIFSFHFSSYRFTAYFFDYVQTVPSQPKTHFQTIFSLAIGATGGAGNLLVTITVQSPEADYDSMKPLFTKILDSYQTS